MQRAEFDRFIERLRSHVETDERIVGLVLLGSAAVPSRIDEWSDHDFWIVTRPGSADAVRSDTSWLPDAHRVVVTTADGDHGRSVIYDDGHLVEYAVFEPDQVRLGQANDYLVLHDEIDLTRTMAEIAGRPRIPPRPDRLFGEVLNQITIGVTRWARGERLSANHLIRGWAARTLVEMLAATLDADSTRRLDDLDPTRRFEDAAPELAAEIDRALESPLLDCAEALVGIAARGVEADPLGIDAVTRTITRARIATDSP